MSDIVDRLRDPINQDIPFTELMLDAAARIEQLEREKAVVNDALQQQSDLSLKYTLEYNEVISERNAFAACIEQLEAEIKTAIRQFEDGNRLECHRTLCTVIYGKQY